MRFHNSLTRAKEDFEPIDPAHVRMYVCGPTVYDLAHLGNARPAIVFDVLFRLLRRRFPRVTYVRNITDVDDKIIARAARAASRSRRSPRAPRPTTTATWRRSAACRPTSSRAPPAPSRQMIALIERLIDARPRLRRRGPRAVLACPPSPEYGALSGRDRDELIAGARVDVAPYKRDPGDFVLWKPSAGDVPGWDSPWGRGRPGWHIECSAMSLAASGRDLRHPRRRPRPALPAPRERGGAEPLRLRHAAHRAHVWMHNGMLRVDGEKMSKSLGNFSTVQDILGARRLGRRGVPAAAR